MPVLEPQTPAMLDHPSHRNKGDCRERSQFPYDNGTLHRPAASVLQAIARTGSRSGRSQARTISLLPQSEDKSVIEEEGSVRAEARQQGCCCESEGIADIVDTFHREWRADFQYENRNVEEDRE